MNQTELGSNPMITDSDQKKHQDSSKEHKSDRDKNGKKLDPDLEPLHMPRHAESDNTDSNGPS